MAASPLDQLLRLWILPSKIAAASASVLAALALALASFGLYAVLSFAVSQRLREIGIRLALGATSRDVAQLVLTDTWRLVGAGLIAGGAGVALGAPCSRHGCRRCPCCAWSDHMIHDVRYAVRALAANPGFTAAAILALALGIGANTAIFTAVYGVLLKPLPYREPDGLVRISETRRGGSWNVAVPNYLDWRARNHVFRAMAIFNTASRVIVVRRPAVPPTSFRWAPAKSACSTSWACPRHRDGCSSKKKGKPGAAVAVITDDIWRRRFGGDPSIVGQAARMDDAPSALSACCRLACGRSTWTSGFRIGRSSCPRCSSIAPITPASASSPDCGPA